MELLTEVVGKMLGNAFSFLTNKQSA